MNISGITLQLPDANSANSWLRKSIYRATRCAATLAFFAGIGMANAQAQSCFKRRPDIEILNYAAEFVRRQNAVIRQIVDAAEDDRN